MISACYVLRAVGPSTLFESASIVRLSVEWPLTALSNFGPGCHYGLFGLLLIAVFTWRVSLGFSSLPLALPESAVSTSDDSASWRRVQNFLWVFLALLAAIDWIYFPTMDAVGHFFYLHVPGFNNVAAVFAQVFVAGSFSVLIAVWMIGREGWHALRQSLRWPGARGLALAVAFPVGISAIISVGQLLFALFLWSADKSGRLGPPDIGAYFTLPSIVSLLRLFFVFAEEIIFRGLLQPRFIRRYGLLRGIFLVGIVFAAAHLNGDFSGSFTDSGVVVRLFVRLSACLPLSFVAGWITLREGSVFPAVVAHGLRNVLGYSPFGPTFWGFGRLIDLLWAILAYVLFRHWPVRAEANDNFARR